MSSVPNRPARYAGLDGLRAIAVALVIAYHLFPRWIFPGGFAGVDVFFVISGFLITSLLLAEHAERGRVSLRGFWKRRARRLLPALALLVTVCSSAAWIVGGDVLSGVGWQVLGTATFSYNWMSIAAGSDYFAAGAPELFRNLWSLAVEEQFYVLWPLLLPLLLLLPWRAVRVGVALVAAGGSAWWMAQLTVAGEVTRGYYGTGSHAFGILLGVALAFALHGLLLSPRPWMRRSAWRGAGALVGFASLAVLWASTSIPADDTAATFPGALLIASLATVAAIAAAVWPGSVFGPAIDVAPLRWIGDRSYGLYLWHWPILVLVTTAVAGVGPEAGVPIPLGLATLVLTFVAAELSYRFVETPVRRHGFRGALRALGASLAGGRRLAAFAGVGLGVLVLGGTTAAIASAPTETSAEEVVQAGLEALEDQPDAEPSATPTPTEEPGPAPSPQPTPVSGAEITAVGDSVMLASAPALVERFPGIQIDAAVSRQMSAAPGILEQLAGSGQLRRYVLVGLGTNGPIDRATLDRLLEIVGPERELIFVRPYAPRDWIPGVDAELASFVTAHRDIEVADWAGAIGARTDLLADDQVHPGGAGGQLFADEVEKAVDEAEAKRAAAAFWRDYHAAQRAQGIIPPDPH